MVFTIEDVAIELHRIESVCKAVLAGLLYGEEQEKSYTDALGVAVEMLIELSDKTDELLNET